jgi:hypothetical protein
MAQGSQPGRKIICALSTSKDAILNCYASVSLTVMPLDTAESITTRKLSVILDKHSLRFAVTFQLLLLGLVWFSD